MQNAHDKLQHHNSIRWSPLAKNDLCDGISKTSRGAGLSLMKKGGGRISFLTKVEHSVPESTMKAGLYVCWYKLGYPIDPDWYPTGTMVHFSAVSCVLGGAFDYFDEHSLL